MFYTVSVYPTFKLVNLFQTACLIHNRQFWIPKVSMGLKFKMATQSACLTSSMPILKCGITSDVNIKLCTM